jgi:hypothetical protein
MLLRGVGVCLLAIVVFPFSAAAHGGVSMSNDKCMLRIGANLMHFTGYQPNESQQEFCEDIPAVGRTVIVLDAVDTELREMTTEIRVIRDTFAGLLGSTPVLSDEDLRSENLDPLTVSYLPARLYPSGTVHFEHVFTQAGKYIGIVTVRNDHGQVYVSQFPFSVGRAWIKQSSVYAALLLAFIVGGIAYWRYYSRKLGKPKQGM